MNAQRCADSRELISALVDGEISPRERIELRAHLAACRECAGVLESYRSIGERIRSLPPVHAPEHLTDTIFAQTIDGEPGRLFLITSRVGYSMAAVAAVALIFIVSGYLIMGGYQRAIQPAVAASAPTVEQDEPWPVQRPIEIEFNKPMNAASVEAALAMEPAGEIERLGYQWSGNTLIIGSNQVLRPDTTYQIRISSDARDDWGNRLDPPFFLRFTTATTVAVFETPTPGAETPAASTVTPTPVIAPATARPSEGTPQSDPAVISPTDVPGTVPPATASPIDQQGEPGGDGTPPAPATPTPTPHPDPGSGDELPPHATPTPTAPSVPTATPTVVVDPTATSTPSPTPTAEAPTSTPTSAPPPTLTPTPETFAVTGAIGNVYWGDELVRSNLGEPLAVSSTTPAQIQGFQRGTMFLRHDIGWIYVLSSDGRWSGFIDSAATLPEPEDGPEPGLWIPGGALGYLWRADSGIAAEIGHATSEYATSFTSTVQEFERGVILVGTNSIYVIYYDGASTWEFYPNIS
ncbi:MAG TPA: Ig-like domain-containing protein [Thermomicrobiales bacterium]|nr:Ig-like domain-containing protein [Thermomicrobiales bacterium]